MKYKQTTKYKNKYKKKNTKNKYKKIKKLPHCRNNSKIKYQDYRKIFLIDFWCFNATFSNISAISWQPALVVEEAGVHGENHRPWASNW